MKRAFEKGFCALGDVPTHPGTAEAIRPAAAWTSWEIGGFTFCLVWPVQRLCVGLVPLVWGRSILPGAGVQGEGAGLCSESSPLAPCGSQHPGGPSPLMHNHESSGECRTASVTTLPAARGGFCRRGRAGEARLTPTGPAHAESGRRNGARGCGGWPPRGHWVLGRVKANRRRLRFAGLGGDKPQARALHASEQ